MSQEQFNGPEIQCHGNPAPSASVPKENASVSPSLFLGAVFTGSPPSRAVGVVPAHSSASLQVVPRLELTRASHLLGMLSTTEM